MHSISGVGLDALTLLLWCQKHDRAGRSSGGSIELSVLNRVVLQETQTFTVGGYPVQ